MLKVYLLLLILTAPNLLKAQDTGTGFGLIKELIESRASAKMAYGAEIEPSQKTSIAPVNFLFSLYRSTISEQISAECAFDLSCSRFSAACIQSHGFIKGIILTSDRLTRCHVFTANETVPILFNNTTGKVIDEPSQY